MLRALAVVVLVALASLASTQGTVVTKRVGRVTIRADGTHAYPGGLFVVTVRGSAPPVLAILDGRRVPFFAGTGVLRALVPISIVGVPDHGKLGIELRSRGRVRIPVGVVIGARSYGARTTLIPASKRALFEHPDQPRETREMLELLRTRTSTQRWRTPFTPPVSAQPEPSFGARQTWIGGTDVESRLDGTWGEFHRGLDYPVAAGTPVSAPAGGTVVASSAYLLNGETVVVDHGQGVVSAFFHLASRTVYDGQLVQAGQRLGTAGDTGIASRPHVHWGVYVNGVAVDPRIFLGPLG